MKPRRLLAVTTATILALLLSATAIGLSPSGGALPASAQQPTPAATATATGQESPCVVDTTKNVYPHMVRVGEPVAVTMTMRGVCPGPVFPLDAVLVLDASRDMAGEALTTMKVVATDVVRAFRLSEHPDSRLAVVESRDGARTLADLTHDETAVIATVGTITATGGSRIDLGLLEASRVLRRGAGTSKDVSWVVILFSKGHSDNGVEPALAAARQLKGQGVLVITVCIADGCKADGMRQLASSPRYYFTTPSAGEALAGVIQQIQDRILNIRFKKIVVTETLSDAVGYVPYSAVPQPIMPDDPSTWWQWQTAYVASDGVTHTYRVRPLQPGYHAVAVASKGLLTDNYGRNKAFDYPPVAILALPGTGGLDNRPCELDVERVAPSEPVRIGETVFVTTTLRVSCWAGLRDTWLTDIVSPDVDYVPAWSGATPVMTTGRRVDHRYQQTMPDATGRLVFTYTHGVRPLHAGAAVPISSDAYAGVVDMQDRADAVEVPAVTLHVLDEQWTPPPTTAPTPTAGSISTPTPTPSPVPVSRTVFLPIALDLSGHVDCYSVDLVLVADLSPSMREAGAPGSPSKLAMAQAAMEALVAGLTIAGDQVALVACNGTARLAQQLTPDRGGITAHIRDLAVQREGSDLAACLAAARTEIDSPRHSPAARPVITVLTDGRADAAAQRAAEEEATHALSAGMMIAVIGLGAEVDQRFLRALAGSPAWLYTGADEEAAVAAARNIAAAFEQCHPRRSRWWERQIP
jgi:Mg-chelatase subunit ChlD